MLNFHNYPQRLINFEASCAKACAAYTDECCGWLDLAAALKRLIEAR